MSAVTLDNKTILVTGAAGFIGSNLVKRIYQEASSATVIGIDNMNAYYDVALKEFRLNELAKYPTFTFVKGNIADKELITELFEKYKKNGEDGLPIPPYAVYNIGNQNPENLLDFVQILSEELVRAKVLPEDYDFEAHKELVPMQPGDVPVTYADTSALERDFGYKPSTSLRTGLRNFAEWYAEFYK